MLHWLVSVSERGNAPLLERGLVSGSHRSCVAVGTPCVLIERPARMQHRGQCENPGQARPMQACRMRALCAGIVHGSPNANTPSTHRPGSFKKKF